VTSAELNVSVLYPITPRNIGHRGNSSIDNRRKFLDTVHHQGRAAERSLTRGADAGFMRHRLQKSNQPKIVVVSIRSKSRDLWSGDVTSQACRALQIYYSPGELIIFK